MELVASWHQHCGRSGDQRRLTRDFGQQVGLVRRFAQPPAERRNPAQAVDPGLTGPRLEPDPAGQHTGDAGHSQKHQCRHSILRAADG